METSVLVVLRTGARTEPDHEKMVAATVAEVMPSQEAVDSVRGWFEAQGFTLGPQVGISFAVTGSRERFEQVLGAQPPDEAAMRRSEADWEMTLRQVPADVSQHIRAITVSRPPDFGPVEGGWF